MGGPDGVGRQERPQREHPCATVEEPVVVGVHPRVGAQRFDDLGDDAAVVLEVLARRRGGARGHFLLVHQAGPVGANDQESVVVGKRRTAGAEPAGLIDRRGDQAVHARRLGGEILLLEFTRVSRGA